MDGIENVTGSTHNDTIVGDANANTINGGKGADMLTGGGGADIFAFAPGDGYNTITDFSSDDKLDFGPFPQGKRVVWNDVNGDSVRVVVNDDVTIILMGFSGNPKVSF